MWSKFSKLNREKLFFAKNQLHAALQLVALSPRSYLPESAEDEYANLSWNQKRKSFFSKHFGPKKNIQTSLLVAEFKLEILVEEIVFDAILINGKTYQMLQDWIVSRLQRLQVDTSKFNPAIPYQLEEIEIEQESKFQGPDNQALKDISSYYQNAYVSFKKFSEEIIQKKKEINIWPHHFDMSIKVPIEQNKTIELGLSPGDQYYPEPYFYGLMSSEVEFSSIRENPPIVGHWHTQKWKGLVLPASQFILETEHLEQQIIIDFLKNAYDISKRLLLLSNAP